MLGEMILFQMHRYQEPAPRHFWAEVKVLPIWVLLPIYLQVKVGLDNAESIYLAGPFVFADITQIWANKCKPQFVTRPYY